MSATEKLYEKYFRDNPCAYEALSSATYAYHLTFKYPYAHSFATVVTKEIINNREKYSKFSDEMCEWCGKTRMLIRWGGNPECQKRPKQADMTVSEVLCEEENKYFALIEDSYQKIPAIVNKKFGGVLSGEALIYCQTTEGYEPDLVSTVMDVDIEQFMPEYEAHMKIHRENSKNTKLP